MSLENMLRKKPVTKGPITVWFHSYEICRKQAHRDRERVVVPVARGERWEVTAIGTGEGLQLVRWSHNLVNILEPTELYAVKW